MMQFRERRRVIQVIRTVYDPDLKRGRSELVGKIDKAAPVVTDRLQKSCTPEELSEILTYLDDRHNRLRNEAVRAGAETLPAQMREAAEYFRTHRDDDARAFATEIRLAWEDLKTALREAGFSKSKVLKKAVDRDKAPEKAPEKAAEKKATAKTEAPTPSVSLTVDGAAEPAAAPSPAAPVRKPRARKARTAPATAVAAEGTSSDSGSAGSSPAA
ncbi:hypothetical protein ABAZ39_12085 [Azospirillum argentinense]|uniref:Uncharacterized protein n=2 Tax=Azospirillum argentinense TaxID=2970906 RepID=A0A060DP74_9PROT|nr:hypothetical protein [Azospirillum argentinense]AIB12714.1 hypothetical protein ABAZ39_12085 [Azospirillum argentinense]EZQ09489.1 hypothetical protein ABAZ39_13510 [Azospirillum argentinense]PNQ96165.1 hypothetical protein C1S70_25170 [Azospirillum argentinense]